MEYMGLMAHLHKMWDYMLHFSDLWDVWEDCSKERIQC